MFGLTALLLASLPMLSPAQTAWLLPVNGTWTTATNWSAGAPSSSVDAIIDAIGAPYVISHSGGTINARTLALNSLDATLALSSATLGMSTSVGGGCAQGAITLSASTLTGRFTNGAGCTITNLAGTSSIRFTTNDGAIRASAGSVSIGGSASPQGWSMGPGALIEADGSSAIIGFVLGAGERWTSAGEIVARNGGQINMGGRNATATLGTLKIFDTARINLSGVIENTGAVLQAPQGGQFDAVGGSVIGGSIAPGAVVLRNRIGAGVVGLRLEGGAMWEGDVTILNNNLRFDPGSDFTGTELNATGAFGVTYVGPATVSGKTITLNTISASKTTFTVGSPTAADTRTVTLTSDTVLRGTAFTIAAEVNTNTLINQGLIEHLSGTSTTNALGTLVNEGRILVNNGTFSIAPGTLNNNGIIEAGPASLVPLATGIAFNQGPAGELRGTGQINLNAPISGGTLRPGNSTGNSIGTLTIQSPFGQPATFTGPTTFAIEIDGASNDQLFFNNGSKGVELGSGTVTLAVNLLSPPTAETYRVVNLAPGFVNPLNGTFAGLPHGSTLTVNHAGIDYNFVVEYDSKGVTLRLPVPTTPLNFIAAFSRKTHGTAGVFDQTLDTSVAISGNVTTESRAIGGGHTIAFRFDGNVATAGSVSVIDTLGNPLGSASTSVAGNEVLVTLTGIADSQRVTISLTGVTGTGGGITNASTSVGFLMGDVTGGRTIPASHVSAIKSRSGQPADGGNFRFDLNASGVVGAADIAAVKTRIGLSLP